MGSGKKKSKRQSKKSPANTPEPAPASIPATSPITEPAPLPTTTPSTEPAPLPTTTPSTEPAPLSTAISVKAQSRPKIFVVYYSTYLHTYNVAVAMKKEIEKVDLCDVELYQIAETLSTEVQTKIKAPAKPDVPIITPEKLKEADGFLFGFPTRYGTLPSQLKEFFDACGQLWATGGLSGKFAGAFVSTATQHGGHESSIFTFMTTVAHFGMMFVPLGYATPLLNEDKVIMGGGPWGATMSAGKDGTRQPSEEELEIARIQGANFSKMVAQYHRGYKPSDIIPAAVGEKAVVSEKTEKPGKAVYLENNTPYSSAVSLLAAGKTTEDAKNQNSEAQKDSPSTPEKFFPAETTSFDDRLPDVVPVAPITLTEGIPDMANKQNPPLSASKALADFSITENSAKEDAEVKSNDSPKLPLNYEAPATVEPNPVDKGVIAEAVSNLDTHNPVQKDPESFIDMAFIDGIFNHDKDGFSTGASPDTKLDSKDKELNGAKENGVELTRSSDVNNVEEKDKGMEDKDTKVPEEQNHKVADEKDDKGNHIIQSSGPDTDTPLMAKLDTDAENNDVQATETKADSNHVANQDGGLKADSAVKPDISAQENSDTTAAANPDLSKSPDVESRGLMAAQAFNNDGTENQAAELKADASPKAVNDPLPVAQDQGPNGSPSLKVPSQGDNVIPATATEASGLQSSPRKNSTNDATTPEGGSPKLDARETGHKKSHQRRASTFARNSASNLKRFFKTLSIRGKPSDPS